MNKGLTILFTSLFGEISSPWDEEYKIAKEIGLNVAKLDEEDFKIKKDLTNQIVIYRGWMLSLKDYNKLTKSIESKNGYMLLTEGQFKKINSFSAWYNILNRYTIKSFFIKENNFNDLNNYFINDSKWFIKDDLKSLGAKKSIANTKEEAIKIYNNIKDNRDFKIENNGIVLREVIKIENEERYFAINGNIISPSKNKDRMNFVQRIVDILLEKIGLHYVVIDIAISNEKNILVEIGGLQVSDISKDGNLEEIKKCYEGFKENISF